jgi:hypothetical protein
MNIETGHPGLQDFAILFLVEVLDADLKRERLCTSVLAKASRKDEKVTFFTCLWSPEESPTTGNEPLYFQANY